MYPTPSINAVHLRDAGEPTSHEVREKKTQGIRLVRLRVLLILPTQNIGLVQHPRTRPEIRVCSVTD
ncbi:hypothetical protein VTO42DRAFT_1588 [Malbranchea cinnamomea]